MQPRGLSPAELLARAIESEAGREPMAGKMAVGEVIANRLASGRWGDSVEDVILAPGQFSAFNNYTGYAGGEGGNDVWKRDPSEGSTLAAQQILSGNYSPQTGGALNYYNPDIANPAWGGDDWQRIGNHVFGTAGGQPSRGGAISTQGSNGPQGGSMQQQGQSPWESILAAAPQAKGSPLQAALMAFAQNAPRMARGQGMDFSGMMGGGAAQQNATIEWLRAKGRDDLAAAVAAGAVDAKSAVALAYEQPDAQEGIEVDGRIINPATGDVIYEPGGGVPLDPKAELDAMKSYRGEADVQTYKDMRNSYERIRKSYQQALGKEGEGDAAGAGLADIALLFGYMKLLDPGSVVREGEFATVQNSGGVGETVRNMYNQVLKGERLSAARRKQIVDAAGDYYGEAAGNLRAVNEQYGSYAGRYGINPEFIMNPEEFEPFETPAAPEMYTPPPAGETAPAPGGFDPSRLRQVR